MRWIGSGKKFRGLGWVPKFWVGFQKSDPRPIFALGPARPYSTCFAFGSFFVNSVYVGWSHVTVICGNNTISTLWGNTAYWVKLSGEELSNKVESVGLRKCPYYHYLTNGVFTRCDRRDDRVYVYTVRSSRRSVARPIAATIAPCKHRVRKWCHSNKYFTEIPHVTAENSRCEEITSLSPYVLYGPFGSAR